MGRPRLTVVAFTVVIFANASANPAAARHPDRSRRTQTGVASFYGHKWAGRQTASGKPYRTDRMTAASPSLPLGTRVRVTNKDTGRTAHVTITDRGPYAKGRILDVTPKAATQLGLTKDDGVADVEVKPVSLPPPPSD